MSIFRRTAEFLGLVYTSEAAPRDIRRKRSRYGLHVSPRLDEDLDEIAARLEDVTARLDRMEGAAGGR